jgi:hypothetical protein
LNSGRDRQRGTPMPKRKQSEGWSATQVLVGLTVVVVLLTWMVSASAYATARHAAEHVAAAEAGDEPSEEYLPMPRPRIRRTGGLVFGAMMIGTFLKNAVVEIPHAPQVVWFALTERWLIPVGFVLTELLVVGLSLGLKVAEQSLVAQPPKRKSKVPEIRVAKPTDD